MPVIHPFQRTICVLVVSLSLIFYFTRLNKSRIEENGEKSTNINSSSIYDDISEIIEDTKNISSNELFHTFKFLNVSLDLPITGEEQSVVKNVEQIYILGLFELMTKLGRRDDGESELMAAKMAVKHVNALNVIPGYELVLLVNDTQCDPGVAIDRFFHAIYSKNTIVMLLSSGCSNVSEALAHVVPYWNIVQISYGSKSPALSDRRKYPLFFRTVAPDSSHNLAKVRMVKRFNWRIVAAFSQTENAYLLPVNHLIAELEKENVSCISTVTFSLETFKEQLKVLKGLDVRIIIGSFSIMMVPHIMCEAYNLNMSGSEYVWILEQSSEFWWTESVNECSPSELLKAATGVFMVGDYENAYHSNAFFEQVVKMSNDSRIIGKYAKYSYDAIWAMSLTLRTSHVKFLNTFNYRNRDAVASLVDTMESLEFIGLSGPVRFNGADRIGDFVVSQIQENGVVNIALYDSIKDVMNFGCKFCRKIYWKNGQIPVAQRKLKRILLTIPNVLFYTIGGISLIGILCSIVFLYFNLKFRQTSTVKLSSPNLNNVAVIGCILVYLSVTLFGFHNTSVKTQVYFDELCSVKIYLLSAGFSLTFGSMLAKSYRVHRLFTYSIPSLVKNRLLRDRQLIGLILIPLFVDALIMGLWIALDPLQRNLHDLIMDSFGDESGVVYQPQVELCLCQNTAGWHVALFGYKTLILIMGVYMAWKTRHVKVPALNESQHIAVCVYSAVFATLIVIVFSFVTQYLVLSYLAKTLSILTSTTITLMLMFLPKLKAILDGVDLELSVMHSMGLKIQCNTRRFLRDDPREVLCRLEIQNKVYRCELEALDKEILHLERLLGSKSSFDVMNPDIRFLKVPRASWPTWHNQAIKQFSSENNVKIERSSFFGKLKMFFGSLSSLQYGYNSLEDKMRDGAVVGGYHKVKPRSNPDIFGRVMLPSNLDFGKIKSENCIRNSY